MVENVTNKGKVPAVMTCDAFDLRTFLPYVLDRAAEETSSGFQRVYKRRHGMLRTEWRVLVHLGRYGAMTATAIGQAARIHKTEISRAVRALGERRLLSRSAVAGDRRQERLDLTPSGVGVYRELAEEAVEYDRALAALFTPEEAEVLRGCLLRLARL